MFGPVITVNLKQIFHFILPKGINNCIDLLVFHVLLHCHCQVTSVTAIHLCRPTAALAYCNATQHQ